ncbi:3355_t:CDS:2, partial [Dentiscutata erythropus]
NVEVEPPITYNKNEKIEINTSNHYKILILITSQLREYRKRNLLREVLFGIENNLEPCIRYNMEIYYKFLIPPVNFGNNKELYRNFVGESIEYNDIVNFQNLLGSNFTQETILKWVQTQKDYNITFDHLVLLDGNSIVNLEEIEYNLSYKDTDDDEYIAKLPYVIWGNFEIPSADNAVIIGAEAIKVILENEYLLQNSNYTNLITRAYFYNKENSQTNFSNELESLIFLNDEEGFIVWNGKVEDIPQNPIISIENLIMADDILRVTNHLSIPYVPACHFTTPSEGEPKIAVVTSSSFKDESNNCKQSILDIAYESAKNKRLYSQKHGYSFIPLQTNKRGIVTWGKMDAIKRTLPYYDWVLWIDTNSVITNYDISVVDLLEKLYLIVGERLISDGNVDKEEKYKKGKEEFNEKIEVVIAESKGEGSDTGLLLIKHSGWSFSFIRNVQAIRDKTVMEKGSIWKFLEDFPEFKNRAKYPLNSSPEDWKEGDLIINYGSEKCPAGSIANSLKELNLNVQENS